MDLKNELTTKRIEKVEKIQKYDEETRLEFFKDLSSGLKEAAKMFKE